MSETPTYAAVPELLDAHRLAIVQAQIEQAQIEAYQLGAFVAALPAGDPQRKDMDAKLKRTRAILAGYRAQEAELLKQLTRSEP